MNTNNTNHFNNMQNNSNIRNNNPIYQNIIPTVNNSHNNQYNKLDYLIQAISNNIINSVINQNNGFNSNNTYNSNNNSNNNTNNNDIFNIGKHSKAIKSKSNEDNKNLIQTIKNEIYQNALQKRKDNINKFLINYRLKFNRNKYKYDNNSQNDISPKKILLLIKIIIIN